LTKAKKTNNKIIMEKKMMTVTHIFKGFYFSKCGGVP